MKKLMPLILAALLTLTACTGTSSSAPAPEDSLAFLTSVWDSFPEDERFPAAGGDTENTNMDGPGRFSTADASLLDNVLGLPESASDKIDDAASLTHMMNANSFTCGAFRLKDPGDAPDVASAIKDNLLQRQWVCGFPDRLIILQTDNYVVSFFGTEDFVKPFRERLTDAYPSAKTLCDEPLA